MAKVESQETKLVVSVNFTYRGHLLLDARRIKVIEEKLQEYADGELDKLMRCLRFSGEPVDEDKK